jgi:NAD+ diphosphatase
LTRFPPPVPRSEAAAAHGPAFTGLALDRAEQQRKDPVWARERRVDPSSRAVIASQDRVLLGAGEGTELARRPLPGEVAEAVLLGLEADGRALFALDRDAVVGTALDVGEDEVRLVSLRDAGARLSRSEGGLAAYAFALLNWHRRNQFCANCGAHTEIAEAGYTRHCPRCQATHFPRLDPVVIMLVEHAGRVLLGRHVGWPTGRYSALAGFVSPGESIEAAVVREVFEESGITARDPTFVASQPWPFPSSLMLGFHANADGGDPVARDGELADVRWFDFAEVSAARAERSNTLQLPPSIAIARFLIERWVAGREAEG